MNSITIQSVLYFSLKLRQLIMREDIRFHSQKKNRIMDGKGISPGGTGNNPPYDRSPFQPLA